MYVVSVLCNLRLRDPIGGEGSLPRCHLGILSIAAYARSRGVTATVFDGDAEGIDDCELLQRVTRAAPALVGIAATQATVQRALQLASGVKSSLPDSVVVLGGEEASFTAPNLLAAHPAVDGVIVGEGEAPFADLAGRLLRRLQPSFEAIPGAVFRGGEGLRWNPPVHEADLDSLPWIGPLQAQVGGPVALVTSRGCCGACTFCSTPRFNRLCRRPAWRGRSPESVVEEIAATASSSPHDPVDIHIHDADFLGMGDEGIARARRIAELLVAQRSRARIRFACQAVTAAKAGVDFWRLWLRAGLMKVFVGYESGVDEDLTFYRKPSRLVDNLAAWRVLRVAGVATQIGFIMYNPFSTPERVAANLSFLRRIGQDHVFKHVASSLEVYPGTAAYDILEDRGLLSTDPSTNGVSAVCVHPRISEILDALRPYRAGLYAQDRVLLDLDSAIAIRSPDLLLGAHFVSLDRRLVRLHHVHQRERAVIIQGGLREMLDAPMWRLQDVARRLASELGQQFSAFEAEVLDSSRVSDKEPANV